MQLAAGFSRDKALAMYARAMKRLSAVIGDQDPSLLSSVMRSRGTRAFYQVRIGADTRPAADDLCNRIRKAGGACLCWKQGRAGVKEKRSPDERAISGAVLESSRTSLRSGYWTCKVIRAVRDFRMSRLHWIEVTRSWGG